MNIRKSMLSAVAAAAIATTFVGCGNDGSIATTTSGNATNLINTPKGTVTGLVQDTNGNPISGVKVYLADKETVTGLGGLYTFNDVPVSTTAGMDLANASRVLSITIAAPEGYLGATVTVTPSAQIDSAEDNGGAGGTTSGSETFVDGYLAQAGTAVLPHLGATVTGKLELAKSEAIVPNQEITLDFLSVGIAGANLAQPQNGVITTYATGNYITTSDENGTFTFTNLPADTDLTYVVPNFTVVGEQVVQGINAVTVTTAGETSVVNIGDLQVNPVVNNDVTAPFVVSTVGQIGNTARQMLEDNVRNTIVINFSESMNIEIDKDFTNSVIVKSGSTAGNMTTRSATATASGSTLTVVLDSDLTDGEFLDINLLTSDFKDAAGNFLTVGAPVAYDFAGAQVTRLQYQAFNDLNDNANSVETVAQQTVDTHGTINDAALLQNANNAFADVVDSGTPDNTIWQMNSAVDNDVDGVADAEARLTALGTAALGAAVTMVTDVPRVTITPSGAAAYNFKLTRNNVDQNLAFANFTVQGGATVATPTNGAVNANGTTTTLLTPASPADVTPVEFIVTTASNIRPGDVVTITPIDDLGYVGTPTTLTIADNVAPTTVLQRSYGLGNDTNLGNTVVKFGDGGELAESAGSITVGTPYLRVTAGLLDNENAAGATVTGVIPSDNLLDTELFAKNTVNTTTSAAYISGLPVYDTTAWTAFTASPSLTRTIGVAFSENIDLNGITPATTNIASTLSGWTLNNDVTINDGNGPVNVDLINFTVDNVMNFANNDHLGVIDFAGIKDAAGNEATAESNAKVVVADTMPPFVTEASFDGISVVMTFNEPIRALTAGDTITVSNTALVPRTATYAAVNAAKYVLSNSNQTLTIDASEFAGLTKTDFNLAAGTEYIEAAYGAVARDHAILSFDDVRDSRGNSWAATAANIGVTPKFAIAEMIGNFTSTTDATGFLAAENTTTNAQVVQWSFAHPIKNDVAGELMNGVALTASGYVWDGAVAADLANITTWFEGVSTGAADVITNIAAPESTSLILSADKRTLTLTFTTTTNLVAGDSVRMITGQVIKSGTDNTQSITGNALQASAQ